MAGEDQRINARIRDRIVDHLARRSVFDPFGNQDISMSDEYLKVRRRSQPYKVRRRSQPYGKIDQPDQPESQTIPHPIRPYSHPFNYSDSDMKGDTCADGVPAHIVLRCGEWIAQRQDQIIYDALRASCTTRFYAGCVAARCLVDTKVTRRDLFRVERCLRGNDAMPITSILGATPNISTKPVQAGFVAVCSTDLKDDLCDLDDFTVTANYVGREPISEAELGSWWNMRFITSAELRPWGGQGKAVGNGFRQTNGNADVYPIIVLAQDCFTKIGLRGPASVFRHNRHKAVPIEVGHIRPRRSSGSHPHGLKGVLAAQFRQACGIENQGWIAVLEVAASKL